MAYRHKLYRLNAFFTNKIKNLIISNDVTLAGEDSLTGILSFGALDSKTFSTGGFLTLKSSAAGTANVADLTNNDVNSGNQVLGDVIVERYIPATKKWRFLSIPTTTTQTIKAAWQEGLLLQTTTLFRDLEHKSRVPVVPLQGLMFIQPHLP